MSCFLYENHRGSPTLILLNVLGVLHVLNVLNVLYVLNIDLQFGRTYIELSIFRCILVSLQEALSVGWSICQIR